MVANNSGQLANEELRVGEAVLCNDGKHLGQVKELRGPYFKIDAPQHPDYWLQLSVVHRDAHGQVVAEFAEADVGTYEIKDIDAALESSGLNQSDASLLGESGTSTDIVDAP